MAAMKLRKTLFRYILVAIISVCYLELASHVYFFTKYRKIYSISSLPDSLTQMPGIIHRGERNEPPNYLGTEIVHPYLGFVSSANERIIRNLGFDTDTYPIQRRESHKLIIALLGGSVSQQLYPFLEKAFKEFMAQRGNPKTPVLINLSYGGIKQPQQLMAIAYLLSLGAQFDLIINVDGFNEVTLPYSQNHKRGVFTAYPRLWDLRIQRTIDAHMLPLIGKITYLRQVHQRELQSFYRQNPFNRSAAFGVLRLWQINRIAHGIVSTHNEITTMRGRRDFEATGPPDEAHSMGDLFAAMVDLWFWSSLQLSRLSAANHIQYFHFIQPNQYVLDSKPFSDFELRNVLDFGDDLHRFVRLGYPMLAARGVELQRENVNFHDATMLFADIADTIYRDTCCHYNEKGNRILAKYIVHHISKRAHIF
ncbi:MAG: hypothetical protein AB1512_26720 [Thermodesulfobacteriota bacterium]